MTESLASRIARAAAGSVLTIPPGEFEGSFVVDRPLIITGAGESTLLRSYDAARPVLAIHSTRVIVRNLRLDHSTAGTALFAAVGTHPSLHRVTVESGFVDGAVAMDDCTIDPRALVQRASSRSPSPRSRWIGRTVFALVLAGLAIAVIAFASRVASSKRHRVRAIENPIETPIEGSIQPRAPKPSERTAVEAITEFMSQTDVRYVGTIITQDGGRETMFVSIKNPQRSSTGAIFEYTVNSRFYRRDGDGTFDGTHLTIPVLTSGAVAERGENGMLVFRATRADGTLLWQMAPIEASSTGTPQ